MNLLPRGRLRLFLVAGGLVVALAAGSTVALAAITGAFSHPAGVSDRVSCSVPALPGKVVDVTLGDMGSMMRGRWFGPNWSSMMRGGPPPRSGWHGMMWVSASPTPVPAGTVSLRVRNAGALIHELMVLPLPAGQSIGQRAIGVNGRVDEASSLGEARPCGDGEDHDIGSGSNGWVTLTLAPGRYELLCNLPGHYPAGMFAQLDVR